MKALVVARNVIGMATRAPSKVSVFTDESPTAACCAVKPPFEVPDTEPVLFTTLPLISPC
jgi:hypothetical protein